MASTTMETITAKVKNNEKALFAKTCDEIGTSPSNAVRMFVSAFNKRGGFPFDTSNPCGFNEETLEAMREVEKMKGDPSLGKIYTDVDLMMEDILK